MDINNFVIDRIRRAVMKSSDDGSIMWSLSDISDPSLSVTTETTDVVDAIGTRIAQFDRGKEATFTGTSGLIDFGLLAAQSGREKNIADSGNLIRSPIFEEVTTTDSQSTVLLKAVPVGATGKEIPFIYAIKGDNNLQTQYKLGATASATDFTLDAASKTLTLPTGLAAGTRLFIPYDYMSDSAVEIVNTAIDYPTAGRFIMEVFGQDVCNPSKKYYAYVIFPNAKLAAAFDLSFASDGGHPFEIAANQDYCDPEKRLFSVIIPEIPA